LTIRRTSTALGARSRRPGRGLRPEWHLPRVRLPRAVADGTGIRPLPDSQLHGASAYFLERPQGVSSTRCGYQATGGADARRRVGCRPGGAI